MNRTPLTIALAMPGVCLAADASSACGWQLLGEQRIPLRLPVAGTPVGGLSGIDFNARRNDWIAISDDRSVLAPAFGEAACAQ